MRDVIDIQGVTKTFGPKVAVNDFDLVIKQGSLYGFIGPNGAGKTTTIRMIMSIIFPDRGTISVLGRPSAVESKDRIGYLPEERGLYRKMRVAPFLEYIARLKGADRAGLSRRVGDWLARVGLAEVARKRCQELSKGMQQKVQFLSAIIHEPELVILDEPFSGLDPVNARLMRDLIHEMHDKGTTVIFSTHVMHHAETICDHIVMINRGTKVLDAPIGDIYARFDPRTILVEPLDPAARGFDARLRQVPGVHAVAAHGEAWEVSLGHGAGPAEVVRDIAAAAAVRRVELRRANLEDIFIDMVHTHGSEPGDETALRAALREDPAAEAAAV